VVADELPDDRGGAVMVSSWRDFLLGLKARGLHGVEFVVADDHAGLRAALREVRRRPITAAPSSARGPYGCARATAEPRSHVYSEALKRQMVAETLEPGRRCRSWRGAMM
jgi:hypothetical protein